MNPTKRRYDRYITQENAYVSLGSGFTKVGSIKDISRGGVAFEYILYEESNQNILGKIDIFIARNGFHLTKIPCDIVYDIPVNTNRINPLFTRNFTYKRCGIKFCDLTENHELGIDKFLKQHTLGLVA